MGQYIKATTMQADPPREEAAIQSRAEWGFVWAVIGLVLLLTGLPYLYAYLTEPANKQFMGLMLDVPDHGQYFSWMRELTEGHLSANKLTPEPNRRVFFNLLWWGLGRLGDALGLGYAAVYQILRFSSAILFLLLAYRIVGYFLKERLHRRTAFLLIAFSSGFGWILVVFKYLLRLEEVPYPLDLYVAEGNTFLSILGYPHFIAAALYILVFDLVLRGQERGQLRYAVLAGFVAKFFGWQHAYDLVLVWGILGGYAVLKLLRDRQIPWYLVWSGLIIFAISFWPALYSVILTTADPVWEEVLGQFDNAEIFTPGLLHLPVLLGATFLLSIYTIIRRNPFRLERWDDKDLFLLAWFVTNFILIYIPADFQIHMLNGWQVPMAILTTMGFFRYIVPWLGRAANRLSAERRPALREPQNVQRLAIVLLFLAVVPTNLYLLAWRFLELSRHEAPYYIYQSEVQALRWLDENGNPDDVVLSWLTVGQYIPALTGKYAFLAHWAQTLDFFEKQQIVYKFFDPGTSDLERLNVINTFSVDYVFYGSAEKSMAGDIPLEAPFLELVYEGDEVQIYTVKGSIQQSGRLESGGGDAAGAGWILIGSID